jgi:hypothetical protein
MDRVQCALSLDDDRAHDGVSCFSISRWLSLIFSQQTTSFTYPH